MNESSSTVRVYVYTRNPRHVHPQVGFHFAFNDFKDYLSSRSSGPATPPVLLLSSSHFMKFFNMIDSLVLDHQLFCTVFPFSLVIMRVWILWHTSVIWKLKVFEGNILAVYFPLHGDILRFSTIKPVKYRYFENRVSNDKFTIHNVYSYLPSLDICSKSASLKVILVVDLFLCCCGGTHANPNLEINTN